MSAHPIYFEQMSDGGKWPACACGEVKLLTDSRPDERWIADHLAWKTATA